MLGGAPGANSGTQATFLARRTAEGWVSKSLVPPASQQIGGGSLVYYPVATSPDFSRFIFAPALPAAISTGPPTFARLDQSGNQQILHSYQSPILSRVDTTADTAHVLIVDPDTRKLEDIGSGSPEEIDLIPPPGTPLGVPKPGGAPPLCGLDPEGGSFIGFGGGSGAASQFEPGYHRMSSTLDRSRVDSQVHPDGGCGSGQWALYERNREANPPTTTAIVPPNQATSDTAIIRATPDGRSAYFVTSSKLDPADKNEHVDVYRWDEQAGKSTCMTCGVKNEDGKKITDANVTSSVLVSDDFSHIYLTSPNKLDPSRGVQGGNNLYVLSAGEVSFVASSVLLGNAVQLSSDGNVLSFLSDKPHTADRIAARCPIVNGSGGNGPCQELYLYDDRNGSVECVSCRHDATAITNNSVALTSPGQAFQSSADGSTVAFTTAEALVLLDVNNSADLYEWRNGSVRLITDGVTRYPLGLAGPIPQAVDTNGSNIVFSLASPGLTGFERDGLANLYDARMGGGFVPPNPPTHCSEESCQGPLQAAPMAAQPGSATYEGPGNGAGAAKPRCRKGKARLHGRCTSKHSHKRQHKRVAHANRGRTK